MPNDKQNGKIFVELAKIAQGSIEHRRTYEWKVAFGLWAAIGIVTYFLAEHKDVASMVTLIAIGFVYAGLGLVWTFLWQVPLHRGHAQDKEWKHFYMGKAEGKSRVRPTERTYCECRNFRSAWLWGQVAVTILFLFASFIVIWRASGPIGDGDAKSKVKVDGGAIEVNAKMNTVPQLDGDSRSGAGAAEE